MEVVVSNKMEHPVRDGVFNYLEMKTSGALLVTGDWGCGKTYFFKNSLFEEIKKDNSFIPVMVSLFGLKELRELPERVLYAYLDKMGKKITRFGKLTKMAKNFIEAIPFVKDYVDIGKLLGSGDGLYRIIPKNVLICFDDIERAIETIDFNEMLGVVNELVENKGYKVIVIANESFITKENGGKHLVFKEKVIEKTLVYIPNVVSLFKEIASSYENPDFVDFMSDIDIIQSINPAEELLADFPSLRKCLSNIRTIKFAIGHFYPVFLFYNTNANLHKDDLIVRKKLKNCWIFILAVSIEYKLNNLSFEDNRGLDTYQNIANIDLDFGDEKEVVFSGLEESEEDKQEKSKKDKQYANLFFKKFFIRISEEPIFHKALYDFVTAGIEVDYMALEENMNQKINIKKGTINPAQELLNLFMNGYWKFRNSEINEKLNALLEYVKDAQLDSYVSYMNATVYLSAFKDLLYITDAALIHEIKSGINKFTDKAKVDYFVRTHIEMAGSQLSADRKWVYDYIMELIDSKMQIESEKEEEIIEEKFHKDLEGFVKDFLPTGLDSNPKYFNVPLLKNFNQEKVETKMQHLEPNDVMCLRTFIEGRYVKMPSGEIKEEVVFLRAIKDGLDKIDSTEKSMTNIIVKTLLNPMLDKALRIVESL